MTIISMYQKVKEYFENKSIPESKSIVTNEKNHGREEKRIYYLETDEWTAKPKSIHAILLRQSHQIKNFLMR